MQEKLLSIFLQIASLGRKHIIYYWILMRWRSDICMNICSIHLLPSHSILTVTHYTRHIVFTFHQCPAGLNVTFVGTTSFILPSLQSTLDKVSYCLLINLLERKMGIIRCLIKKKKKKKIVI